MASVASAGGRLPITIVTGFAGAGKTTLILNLLPQLRQDNPGYRLALIKNEIGDVNVDSQLAAAAEMAGSKELLGDCICCTNVGQIGDALATLDNESHPDRIIIETSGSAEPLKLVLEVNRLIKETGRYELDGIVSVIDAENWSGYANTSYTAKLQAQQTDMIIINKWEKLNDRTYDLFLDKLGDLDVDTPQIKSDNGWVSKDLLFGVDLKTSRAWIDTAATHAHDHLAPHNHRSEMECLSITLSTTNSEAGVNIDKLLELLKTAPKDEIYRIKAIMYANAELSHTNDGGVVKKDGLRSRYILNWSFGRWTWLADHTQIQSEPVLRMSIFTAQYASSKWMKRLNEQALIAIDIQAASDLKVTRVQ